jgi:hypothetical protein
LNKNKLFNIFAPFKSVLFTGDVWFPYFSSHLYTTAYKYFATLFFASYSHSLQTAAVPTAALVPPALWCGSHHCAAVAGNLQLAVKYDTSQLGHLLKNTNRIILLQRWLVSVDSTARNVSGEHVYVGGGGPPVCQQGEV